MKEKASVKEDEGLSPPSAFSTREKNFNKSQKQQQGQPKKKREGTCHNCGKAGHWARECRSKPKNRDLTNNTQRQPEGRNGQGVRHQRRDVDEGTSDCQAFMLRGGSGVEEQDNSVMWISDSGATTHVTGRKDWLENYEEFTTPRPVYLTTNDSAQ